MGLDAVVSSNCVACKYIIGLFVGERTHDILSSCWYVFAVSSYCHFALNSNNHVTTLNGNKVALQVTCS